MKTRFEMSDVPEPNIQRDENIDRVTRQAAVTA